MEPEPLEDLKNRILSALAVELSEDMEFLQKINRLSYGLLRDDKPSQ
tara:strand:+ start:136 stop:276 length:141 start_codon:yes stop_codon:yes gene_type:complete